MATVRGSSACTDRTLPTTTGVLVSACCLAAAWCHGTKANTGNLGLSNLQRILKRAQDPLRTWPTTWIRRALDGRQTDANFEASWTYHPDDGLDVLIREK